MNAPVMRFVDVAGDPWQAAEAGAAPREHALLTLADWQAVRSHWPSGLSVGVQVPNDADIEALVDDLPRLALVALHFPKWTDGRAYSQARLLRSRYRHAGEVRATGEVLVDMLPLLQRTGFDAVVLAPGQSLTAAQRALRFFPSYYQGDVHRTRPLFARADA